MQINKADFDIVTVEDEIRVDALCKSILMNFYEALLSSGMDQGGATILANGADHFIREFLVGVKFHNIFDEKPGVVRQFAGNWYIVNTLEPTVEYLANALPGVASFYRFLAEKSLVSADYYRIVKNESEDLEFYRSRIDSFWEITGDGYAEWEKGCSLRDHNSGSGSA